MLNGRDYDLPKELPCNLTLTFVRPDQQKPLVRFLPNFPPDFAQRRITLTLKKLEEPVKDWLIGHFRGAVDAQPQTLADYFLDKVRHPAPDDQKRMIALARQKAQTIPWEIYWGHDPLEDLIRVSGQIEEPSTRIQVIISYFEFLEPDIDVKSKTLLHARAAPIVLEALEQVLALDVSEALDLAGEPWLESRALTTHLRLLPAPRPVRALFATSPARRMWGLLCHEPLINALLADPFELELDRDFVIDSVPAHLLRCISPSLERLVEPLCSSIDAFGTQLYRVGVDAAGQYTRLLRLFDATPHRDIFVCLCQTTTALDTVLPLVERVEGITSQVLLLQQVRQLKPKLVDSYLYPRLEIANDPALYMRQYQLLDFTRLSDLLAHPLYSHWQGIEDDLARLCEQEFSLSTEPGDYCVAVIEHLLLRDHKQALPLWKAAYAAGLEHLPALNPTVPHFEALCERKEFKLARTLLPALFKAEAKLSPRLVEPCLALPCPQHLFNAYYSQLQFHSLSKLVNHPFFPHWTEINDDVALLCKGELCKQKPKHQSCVIAITRLLKARHPQALTLWKLAHKGKISSMPALATTEAHFVAEVEAGRYADAQKKIPHLKDEGLPDHHLKTCLFNTSPPEAIAILKTLPEKQQARLAVPLFKAYLAKKKYQEAEECLDLNHKVSLAVQLFERLPAKQRAPFLRRAPDTLAILVASTKRHLGFSALIDAKHPPQEVLTCACKPHGIRDYPLLASLPKKSRLKVLQYLTGKVLDGLPHLCVEMLRANCPEGVISLLKELEPSLVLLEEANLYCRKHGIEGIEELLADAACRESDRRVVTQFLSADKPYPGDRDLLCTTYNQMCVEAEDAWLRATLPIAIEKEVIQEETLLTLMDGPLSLSRFVIDNAPGKLQPGLIERRFTRVCKANDAVFAEEMDHDLSIHATRAMIVEFARRAGAAATDDLINNLMNLLLPGILQINEKINIPICHQLLASDRDHACLLGRLLLMHGRGHDILTGFSDLSPSDRAALSHAAAALCEISPCTFKPLEIGETDGADEPLKRCVIIRAYVDRCGLVLLQAKPHQEVHVVRKEYPLLVDALGGYRFPELERVHISIMCAAHHEGHFFDGGILDHLTQAMDCSSHLDVAKTIILTHFDDPRLALGSMQMVLRDLARRDFKDGPAFAQTITIALFKQLAAHPEDPCTILLASRIFALIKDCGLSDIAPLVKCIKRCVNSCANPRQIARSFGVALFDRQTDLLSRTFADMGLEPIASSTRDGSVTFRIQESQVAVEWRTFEALVRHRAWDEALAELEYNLPGLRLRASIPWDAIRALIPHVDPHRALACLASLHEARTRGRIEENAAADPAFALIPVLHKPETRAIAFCLRDDVDADVSDQMYRSLLDRQETYWLERFLKKQWPDRLIPNYRTKTHSQAFGQMIFLLSLFKDEEKEMRERVLIEVIESLHLPIEARLDLQRFKRLVFTLLSKYQKLEDSQVTPQMLTTMRPVLEMAMRKQAFPTILMRAAVDACLRFSYTKRSHEAIEMAGNGAEIIVWAANRQIMPTPLLESLSRIDDTFRLYLEEESPQLYEAAAICIHKCGEGLQRSHRLLEILSTQEGRQVAQEFFATSIQLLLRANKPLAAFKLWGKNVINKTGGGDPHYKAAAARALIMQGDLPNLAAHLPSILNSGLLPPGEQTALLDEWLAKANTEAEPGEILQVVQHLGDCDEIPLEYINKALDPIRRRCLESPQFHNAHSLLLSLAWQPPTEWIVDYAQCIADTGSQRDITDALDTLVELKTTDEVHRQAGQALATTILHHRGIIAYLKAVELDPSIPLPKVEDPQRTLAITYRIRMEFFRTRGPLPRFSSWCEAYPSEDPQLLCARARMHAREVEGGLRKANRLFTRAVKNMPEDPYPLVLAAREIAKGAKEKQEVKPVLFLTAVAHQRKIFANFEEQWILLWTDLLQGWPPQESVQLWQKAIEVCTPGQLQALLPSWAQSVSQRSDTQASEILLAACLCITEQAREQASTEWADLSYRLIEQISCYTLLPREAQSKLFYAWMVSATKPGCPQELIPDLKAHIELLISCLNTKQKEEVAYRLAPYFFPRFNPKKDSAEWDGSGLVINKGKPSNRTH